MPEEQPITPPLIGLGSKELEDRKLRLYEEQRYVTSRIGETSRYIGFGVIAIFYAIVTDDGAYAAAVVYSHSLELYAAGVAGVATICFDYLQYLTGEWSVTKALRRKDEPFLFNTRWWPYRLRMLFYRLKQATAFIAAITLLYIVVFTVGGWRPQG